MASPVFPADPSSHRVERPLGRFFRPAPGNYSLPGTLSRRNRTGPARAIRMLVITTKIVMLIRPPPKQGRAEGLWQGIGARRSSRFARNGSAAARKAGEEGGGAAKVIIYTCPSTARHLTPGHDALFAPSRRTRSSARDSIERGGGRAPRSSFHAPPSQTGGRNAESRRLHAVSGRGFQKSLRCSPSNIQRPGGSLGMRHGEDRLRRTPEGAKTRKTLLHQHGLDEFGSSRQGKIKGIGK